MYQVDISSCTGCGTCVKACPTDAIEIVAGTAVIDHSLCNDCGSCFFTCPQGAIYQDEAAPAATPPSPSTGLRSPLPARSGVERRWPAVLATIAPAALDLALEIARRLPSRRDGRLSLKTGTGGSQRISSPVGSGRRYRRRGGRA